MDAGVPWSSFPFLRYDPALGQCLVSAPLCAALGLPLSAGDEYSSDAALLAYALTIERACVASASCSPVDVPLEAGDGTEKVFRTCIRKANGILECFLTDITDLYRQQPQEEAARKALLYDSIIQSRCEYIIHTDLEGRYTYCNRAFIDHFGVEHNIIGTNSLESIIPEDRHLAVGAVPQCFSQPGAPVPCILRKQHVRTGEILWTEWEFSAIVDARGNALGIQCVGVDRTSERKSLLALEENDRILKEFSKQLPGTIYIFCFHADGRRSFPYASRSMKDVFGIDPAEVWLDGSVLLDRIHLEENDDLLETIAASARDLSVWEREFLYDHPTKGWVWIGVHGTPERHSDGSVVWYCYAADITGDHRSRERQRLLSLIAENTRTMVIIADAEKNVEWVNESFTRITGYSLEEIAGTNPGKLLQGKGTSPETIAEMRRCFSRREPYRGEILNFAKDGTPLWIEADIQPVFDSRGALTHYVALHTDITDIKRREEDLAHTNTLLELIFNTTNVSYCLLDKDCRMLMFNRQVADSSFQVWGRMPQVGDFFYDYGGNLVLKEALEASVAKAFQGEDISYTKRITLGDIDIGWWEISYCPVKLVDGSVASVLFSAQNVTEQETQREFLQDWNHRLEELVAARTAELQARVQEKECLIADVREKEQLLHKIAISSPDVIFLYDMETRREIYSTKSLKEVLGFAPEVPVVLSDVKPEQEQVSALERVAELREGIFLDDDKVLYDAHGVRRTFRYRVTVFSRNDDGTPRVLYGIASDETAKRMAEEEREEFARSLEQKNKELQELNAEKSEIMGIVAHDLRNLINAILLSADVLREYKGRLTPEKEQAVMERIYASGTKMRDFLTQMLSAEAISNGSVPCNPEPLSLKAILAEVCATYEEAAAKKRLSVVLDIPEAEMLFAYADKAMVTHIAENLISNAIKFSHHSAEIRVGIREELIHDRPWVALYVRDGGPGLSAADFENLFKRYRRLSAKPTGGEISSGLGLSIVKKLVELNGGAIEAANADGGGAVFTVYLPVY